MCVSAKAKRSSRATHNDDDGERGPQERDARAPRRRRARLLFSDRCVDHSARRGRGGVTRGGSGPNPAFERSSCLARRLSARSTAASCLLARLSASRRRKRHGARQRTAADGAGSGQAADSCGHSATQPGHRRLPARTPQAADAADAGRDAPEHGPALLAADGCVAARGASRPSWRVQQPLRSARTRNPGVTSTP